MAADGILVGLSLMAGVVLGPLALLLMPAALLILQRLRAAGAWRPLLLAVIGVLLGMWRAAAADESPPVPKLAASREAVGTVAAIPVAGGQAERSVLRLERLQAADGTWGDASGRVVIYLRAGMNVSSGDRVWVAWSAASTSSAPPGYDHFLASQRADGSAHVWSLRTLDQGPTWSRALAATRRLVAGRLVARGGDAGGDRLAGRLARPPGSVDQPSGAACRHADAGWLGGDPTRLVRPRADGVLH